MKKLTCFFFMSVFLFLYVVESHAALITVSVEGGWAMTGIGNDDPEGYDRLAFTGTTAPLPLNLQNNVPYETSIGTLTFSVGNTGSNSVGRIVNGQVITNITANGATASIRFPWTVTIGSSHDSFQAFSGNMTTLDLGTSGWLDVTLHGWGYQSQGGVGAIISRPIYGDFELRSSVPIPGAIWLLGTGLVALIGLRRRGRN